jgi:hypothetical protein
MIESNMIQNWASKMVQICFAAAVECLHQQRFPSAYILEASLLPINQQPGHRRLGHFITGISG